MFIAAEIELKRGNNKNALEIYENILETDHVVNNLGIGYDAIIDRAKFCVGIIKKELKIA